MERVICYFSYIFLFMLQKQTNLLLKNALYIICQPRSQYVQIFAPNCCSCKLMWRGFEERSEVVVRCHQ